MWFDGRYEDLSDMKISSTMKVDRGGICIYIYMHVAVAKNLGPQYKHITLKQ